MIIYNHYHNKCLNSYILKWNYKAEKRIYAFNENNNKAYIKKKINNVPLNNLTDTSYLNNKSQNITHSQSFHIQISNEANFSITDRINSNKIKRQRSYKEIIPLTHSRDYSLNSLCLKNKSKQMKVPKLPEHPKVSLTVKEKEELFNSLYNDSKNRKEKLRQMLFEKEQFFNSQYTFTPQLATRVRSSEKYRYSNDTSFIERLIVYNQSRKSNLKKIEQEVIESLPKPKQCKKSSEFQLISKSQDYKQIKQEKIRIIENAMR